MKPKISMSIDRFCELSDKFSNFSHQCIGYIPSAEDLEELKKEDPKDQLLFLMWVSETGQCPDDPDAKDKMKFINKRINELVNLDENTVEDTNKEDT